MRKKFTRRIDKDAYACRSRAIAPTSPFGAGGTRSVPSWPTASSGWDRTKRMTRPTVADLLRLKAELPLRPLAELGLRPEEMVWNACQNLLALHYDADFGSSIPLIPDYGTDTMALADGKVLLGHAVDDRPLNVSFCGTPGPVGTDADEFSVYLARMAGNENMSETDVAPLG